MIIAVNAVTPAFKPATGNFFIQAFLHMAVQQPQHHFLFIGVTSGIEQLPHNCTVIAPGIVIKSPLRFLYWLNFKLPALLKKNKAAVVVHHGACSLRLKLPQLLYLDAFLTPLAFYKKNTRHFIQKAAHTLVSSQYLQQQINQYCQPPAGSLSIVYAAAQPVFTPVIHWNQKEAMKDRLTQGKEYFLYSGIISEQYNLIQLLKAFSFFKQRQKSNMQLVLASQQKAAAAFVKSLSSYKYRTDVVLAENLPVQELAAITAAAYAVVQPAQNDAAGTTVLQALQCSTPVAAANDGALPEVGGQAAIYFNAADYNDIAAKMMLLFTNEDKRNQLIALSRAQIQAYSFKEAANSLWQQTLHVAGG